MASLNAFGAIFSYAIELETRLRDYYQAAGDNPRAADADKRRSNLERVRRENVTEIKLEPLKDSTKPIMSSTSTVQQRHSNRLPPASTRTPHPRSTCARHSVRSNALPVSTKNWQVLYDLEPQDIQKFEQIIHRLDPKSKLVRTWVVATGVVAKGEISRRATAHEIEFPSGHRQTRLVRQYATYELKRNPQIARTNSGSTVLAHFRTGDADSL